MSHFHGSPTDSFLAHASLLTTTSQYSPVAISANSAGGSPTCKIATATSESILGVNMTYFTGSTDTQKAAAVITRGLARVYCAASITAGDLVGAAASATGGAGAAAVVTLAPGSVATFSWALGRALENGSTNQAIQIWVGPQLIANQTA